MHHTSLNLLFQLSTPVFKLCFLPLASFLLVQNHKHGRMAACHLLVDAAMIMMSDDAACIR
jgi:hypothetical protein